MAITKNAKKAIRSSQMKRVYNIRTKAVLHDVVKEYTKLTKEQKTTEAQALLPQVYKALDKAAKRHVITKNTASRKKARLSKRVATKG